MRLKKQRRDRPDQRGQKVHFQNFRDRGGDGTTKNHFIATVVEASDFRVQTRGDFSDQGGDGATFQTEAETARLRNNSLRPWWMRRDFSNQSGDSPDHGAYGATFQNKAQTARLSRPRRRILPNTAFD